MTTKLTYLGEDTFVDPDAVEAPEGSDPVPHIYAYAHFPSLERVSYGLMRTKGKATDEEIESVKVGSYGMEVLAPYREFKDALEELEDGSRHGFEEVPFVEVETHDQYEEALEVIDLAPSDSDWKGPGLYDFRDDPPSFQGSVEAYEQKEMERAADEAIDFMFQGDEWENAFHELGGEEE